MYHGAVRLMGEWKLLLQGKGKEDSMVKKITCPCFFMLEGMCVALWRQWKAVWWYMRTKQPRMM